MCPPVLRIRVDIGSNPREKPDPTIKRIRIQPKKSILNYLSNEEKCQLLEIFKISLPLKKYREKNARIRISNPVCTSTYLKLEIAFTFNRGRAKGIKIPHF